MMRFAKPYGITAKAAVCVFIAAFAASAQIPEAQKSGASLNGRFWETLPYTQKLPFVIGFADAIVVAQYLSPDVKLSSYYFSNSTNGEVVKGLDQFYEDPANAIIPISSAMTVFVRKVAGATPEALAQYTATLRRIFNSASAAPPPAKSQFGGIPVPEEGSKPVSK